MDTQSMMIVMLDEVVYALRSASSGQDEGPIYFVSIAVGTFLSSISSNSMMIPFGSRR
jgi:hypothetical protein